MSNAHFSSTLELQTALSLHQQGKIDEAEASYRRIILNAPDNALVYGYLGRLLGNKGKLEEAKNIMEQGLLYDDKQPDLLSTLIQVYVSLKDGDKAVSTARKLVKLFPNQPEAHLTLGNALYFSGQEKEAVIAIKKSLKINSKYAAAYLGLGDLYSRSGKYQVAEKAYRDALKIDSKNVSAIVGLGMAKHAGGKVEDAARQYERASKLAPNDLHVLTLLANVYRDMGDNEQALKYYDQVLRFDPDNAIAQENISKIKGSAIQSWHFTMLSDEVRNRAYHEAIKSLVKEGDHVLDIGAGTGLLSLMAAEAGAERVTAFEMLSDIALIAQKVVSDNEYDDVVEIINKKSTAGEIGADLPKKANVLISEILDTGLLGEGVVAFHRHALENFLVDDPVVIPASGTVHGCLIQSDSKAKVYPIKEIEGFDLSAFNDLRDPGDYLNLNLDSIDYQKLTDVIELQSVDFKHLPPLYTDDDPLVKPVKFTINEDGVVHAIAFWFDLYLTPEIKHSTGPDGDMHHWRQACFFFKEPRHVKKGDEVTVNLLQTEMRFRFELA